jgi:Ca2+-binding RTX toxin-like protein
LLVGGSGRDLLIGGLGADRIVGNAADDILIAGRTAYDLHDLALCKIMAEWTSERDYLTRVANLRDGTGSPEERENGEYFLRTQQPEGSELTPTVFDDGARDVLTGSSGLDWFIFNTDEDKATDPNDEEFDDVRDFVLAEV